MEKAVHTQVKIDTEMRGWGNRKRAPQDSERAGPWLVWRNFG